MEYSAKTTLPLNSISIIYPLQVFRHLSNWYNLSLIFLFINGGENKKGSQSLHFWRLTPKGEKVLAQSKRTAPPPQISKTLVFNWYQLVSCYWYISNGYDIFNWYNFLSSISNIFPIGKTLLKTKRRISFRGSFCLSQRKSI
jgi:hypothetical protein